MTDMTLELIHDIDNHFHHNHTAEQFGLTEYEYNFLKYSDKWEWL